MIRWAWRDFALAVRFLTVVPVRAAPAIAGAPTIWFPAVGLLLGAALLGFRVVLPAEGLLPAALVLAAWTILTGGLHEDGWADCADAALPPVDRARRLEILRDPRIGAYGLVAVALLLLVRLVGIGEAPPWALLVAPVVGRWAMVLSLASARPLRPTGLGASMAAAARPGPASVVAVSVLAGPAALVVAHGAPDPGAAAVIGAAAAIAAATAVAALAALALGTFLRARFGGLSGDGHGAVGLAAETAVLAWLALGGAHAFPALVR